MRPNVRVVLEQETRTDQGGGVETKTWTAVDTIRATVDSFSGSQQLLGLQTFGAVPVTVTHRVGGTRPTTKMRYAMEDRSGTTRYLYIEAVRDLTIRRQDFYEATCLEKTA